MRIDLDMAPLPSLADCGSHLCTVSTHSISDTKCVDLFLSPIGVVTLQVHLNVPEPSVVSRVTTCCAVVSVLCTPQAQGMVSYNCGSTPPLQPGHPEMKLEGSPNSFLILSRLPYHPHLLIYSKGHDSKTVISM